MLQNKIMINSKNKNFLKFKQKIKLKREKDQREEDKIIERNKQISEQKFKFKLEIATSLFLKLNIIFHHQKGYYSNLFEQLVNKNY